MAGITQRFIGELWFTAISGAGIRIPVLAGATLSAPENFSDADPVTSNLFEVTDTAGLQYPILSCPLLVTKEWFTAANLNAWFNLPRVGTGPYYDVPVIATGVYFWNGVTGQTWLVSGAKVNFLSLGYSQGAYVDARMEIWGVLMAPSAGALPTTTPFNSAPARSQNCSHTLAKNHTRFDITLRNNLILNDECPSDTTRQAAPYSTGVYDFASTFERPLEINATRFSAEASATFQAHDVTGLPGSTPSIVDATSFDVNIWAPQTVKTNTGVKITVPNPHFYSRWQSAHQQTRQRRTLGIRCKGQTAGGEPVVITAWTPT